VLRTTQLQAVYRIERHLAKKTSMEDVKYEDYLFVFEKMKED